MAKHSNRGVLSWNIAFVQFKVRVDRCTNLIIHCKTLKKTCFAVEYRTCAISSQSWHLHISDFPQQNTEDVFCSGVLHLCNLKSQLTVAQISFSTVKHSKKRVLRWIIAFGAIVRIGTCAKLIFQCKMHKKTFFEVEYRFCFISSLS